MKRLIYIFIVLVSFSSFSQEVFDYEFDDNVTIQVLEDTEEGEIAGGKFVKGTYKNEIVIFVSSDKGMDKMINSDDAGLLKFFQGVKDGAIKSSKGTLLNEEVISIQDQKAFKFSYTLNMEGKKNRVDTYVFIYKNVSYSLQFVNSEKGFEKGNDLRKQILESIVLK
ncbi:MAG TPA: hypothetical protein PLL09_09815 [Flavobacterium sp.]|uniref:hypothetical protein n=1 Tax=unclassified Flavobacterium TaxID=196869 RepID=UPI000E9763FB|nr:MULTISPECIES: hypothetical protein [unclassified Flavobacterium]HBH99990.1 hypothetical protein [Flavobacterium sp.]HRE78105.1 hypothetical protein [Flavobacterium sp.]